MRRLFGMIPLCLMAAALTMTGCSRQQAAPPPPAAVAPPPPPASSPAAAPFQPYALISQPPPKPKVATHRNEVLRVTRRAGRIFLADSEGHLYRCGRDRRGHVFPIYQDPATHVTYPLYYDRSRDRLYRLARNDDGHYYRGYVGDPDNRFYQDDPDFERIRPVDRDRPIVTDSDNRYNYNDYGGYPNHHEYRVSEGTYYPPPYPYSQPSAHHSTHNNANWLWAVPVIIGAYLLLNPHHHSSPPPPPTGTVIVQRHGPPTIINRTVTINHTNNTIINRTNTTVINHTRTVVLNRPAPNGNRPVRPMPAPRPVALAHPSPPHPFSPVRPRAAAGVGPALLALHHAARPHSAPPSTHHRPRTVVVHRPPVGPAPLRLAPARLRLVPGPHPAQRHAQFHAAALPRPRPHPAHHATHPVPAAPPVQHHPSARLERARPSSPVVHHAHQAVARPRAAVAVSHRPRPTPQVVRHAPPPSHARPVARHDVKRPAPPPHRAAPPHSAPRPSPHPAARPRLAPRPAPHPQGKPGPDQKHK